MEVIEIKEKEFKEKTKEKGIVLVDCYAPWCGPCRQLSPIIDDLASETEDCKFYKLNVDEAEDISREYGIMSIPTLLFFKDNELKEKTIGFKTKEELKKIIDSL